MNVWVVARGVESCDNSCMHGEVEEWIPEPEIIIMCDQRRYRTELRAPPPPHYIANDQKIILGNLCMHSHLLLVCYVIPRLCGRYYSISCCVYHPC